MKHLIVGGAGFIGRNLIKKLKEDKSNEIFVIDDLSTGRLDEILDETVQSVNFHYGNIGCGCYDCMAVTEERIFDQIWHLASPCSPNPNNSKSYINRPIETFNANVIGLQNITKHFKFKKLLIASSSEIYGNPEVSPQKEEYFGNCNSFGMRSIYDESKRMLEALAYEYIRKGMDIKIARIFNTYSNDMPEDGRLISEMFRAHKEIKEAKKYKDPHGYELFFSTPCGQITIFGDGNQKRSFCHVSDMVEGLIKLMDSNLNEPINLGNPNEITVNQAIEIFEKKYGALNKKYKTALKDDPTNRCPDITKAKELLNWEPTISFEFGI